MYCSRHWYFNSLSNPKIKFCWYLLYTIFIDSYLSLNPCSSSFTSIHMKRIEERLMFAQLQHSLIFYIRVGWISWRQENQHAHSSFSGPHFGEITTVQPQLIITINQELPFHMSWDGWDNMNSLPVSLTLAYERENVWYVVLGLVHVVPLFMFSKPLIWCAITIHIGCVSTSVGWSGSLIWEASLFAI